METRERREFAEVFDRLLDLGDEHVLRAPRRSGRCEGAARVETGEAPLDAPLREATVQTSGDYELRWDAEQKLEQVAILEPVEPLDSEPHRKLLIEVHRDGRARRVEQLAAAGAL